jgi:hypothetical protein
VSVECCWDEGSAFTCERRGVRAPGRDEEEEAEEAEEAEEGEREEGEASTDT